MPRPSFVIAISLLSVALTSVATRAGGAPPSVKPAEASAPAAPETDLPQFTLLDVNGDTAISSEEAQAHARLAAIFAECDSDKDGSLSTWEFAEARSKLTR